MTNAELIKLARQITDLHAAQTLVREVGITIVDQGRRDSVMQSMHRIGDDLVTMCSDMRRLCQEPYGDTSAATKAVASELNYYGHTFFSGRTAKSRCLGCGETWSVIVSRMDPCPESETSA